MLAATEIMTASTVLGILFMQMLDVVLWTMSNLLTMQKGSLKPLRPPLSLQLKRKL